MDNPIFILGMVLGVYGLTTIFPMAAPYLYILFGVSFVGLSLYNEYGMT